MYRAMRKTLKESGWQKLQDDKKGTVVYKRVEEDIECEVLCLKDRCIIRTKKDDSIKYKNVALYVGAYTYIRKLFKAYDK